MNYLRNKASRIGVPFDVLVQVVDTHPPAQCHFCGSCSDVIGKHVFLSNKTEYKKELGLDGNIILILGWCEGCWVDLCFEHKRTVFPKLIGQLIDREIEQRLDDAIAAKRDLDHLF